MRRLRLVRPRPRTVLVLAVVVVLLITAGMLRWALRGPVPPPSARPAASCGVPLFAPRELRAMWLTTVNNIDFPSRPGLTPDQVKAEYLGWLDLARQQRHNAIFVHVRPSGDAFWPSAYAPISEWLTGTRDGKDPGWDPMAFMVAEAHARNLEFHAWFNPYRASQPAPAGAGTDRLALAPNHPLRRHPEWAIAYPPGGEGARLYFDPGQPDARRFVEDAMLEAVARYDVDGVHFDDFFYPYPKTGQEFGDAASFARFGAGLSRDDWRRENVNSLVRETGERIRALKPWVAYGISPFGIWRNAADDPSGSPTRGLQSYSAIYADTRRWIREEWIDYVVPQLYWNIGFDTADYARLLPWWSAVVAGTRVRLWIGHADYRVGEQGAWSDPAELDRQLALNRRYPVTGGIHFSAKQIRADRLGAVTRYRDTHYTTPALVPLLARRPTQTPGAPVITGVHGDTVSWRPGPGPAPTSWALYRVDGAAARLVATGRGGDAAGVGAGRFCLTVLDRSGHESPAAGT